MSMVRSGETIAPGRDRTQRTRRSSAGGRLQEVVDELAGRALVPATGTLDAPHQLVVASDEVGGGRGAHAVDVGPHPARVEENDRREAGGRDQLVEVRLSLDWAR